MAGYFKKRKIHHGPNKNEQKVIRSEQAKRAERMAGVLSGKFPTVKHLNLHLTFVDHDHLIDEQDLSIEPNQTPSLAVPCPGRCGRGSLDMTEKLSAMFEARTESAEDRLACALPLYAGSGQTCGCEVRWRAQAEYFPEEDTTLQSEDTEPQAEEAAPQPESDA
ncbi:MAG TPA: hypothetical protein VNH15_01995 [Elusimicrobiota bacterium]|nr:hypothetical protein [Elusimicrobiota bacterium]